MEAVAKKQKFAFHEIEESIKAIFAAMDEADNPEDPAYQEELEAALGELATAEADKADGLAFVLAELEARREAIKQTEQSLANRRHSLENRAASLKRYALQVMQNHGIKKIAGASATLSIRKGSISVYVDPAAVEILPFNLIRTKVEADKAAIKEVLEAGQEVTGCSLQVGLDSLSIRRA